MTATEYQPDLFDMPVIVHPALEPTARKSDPATSREAAKRATASAENTRGLALRTLRAAGSRGLNDFELASIVGIPQTSVGVRRGELVRMGLVEATEMRRPSPSGSPCIVWRAV